MKCYHEVLVLDEEMKKNFKLIGITREFHLGNSFERNLLSAWAEVA